MRTNPAADNLSFLLQKESTIGQEGPLNLGPSSLFTLDYIWSELEGSRFIAPVNAIANREPAQQSDVMWRRVLKILFSSMVLIKYRLSTMLRQCSDCYRISYC